MREISALILIGLGGALALAGLICVLLDSYEWLAYNRSKRRALESENKRTEVEMSVAELHSILDAIEREQSLNLGEESNGNHCNSQH
jgi:hypothetical protein